MVNAESRQLARRQHGNRVLAMSGMQSCAGNDGLPAKTVGARRVVWVGMLLPHVERELVDAGWRAIRVDLEDAAAALARSGVGVAVADLSDGAADRVTVLEKLIAEHHDIQWLAVTSQQALALPRVRSLIVDLCFDYLSRPLHISHLASSLGHAWGKARLLQDHRQDADTQVAEDDLGLVGTSDAMNAMRDRLRKFARVDMPVLIGGETGTGKDVAARALWALSERHACQFAAIDCGALPENLVQSELFGHERGAFTGAATRKIGRIEAAQGGVVFLDEIGDLPLDAQSNLLRFLQESTIQRVGSTTPVTVDARVIAATHVDLERAVREGRFREDLYYRLNVLHLQVPPLRERSGDAELLAAHFLAAFRREHRTRVRGFSMAARKAIAVHSWPGNVRELINRVQGAAVVAERPWLTPADLGLAPGHADVGMVPSLDAARADAERETILASLQQSRFNLSECARRLKISRVTLYRLCKKYQLKTSAAVTALAATGAVAYAAWAESPLAAWAEAAEQAAAATLG